MGRLAPAEAALSASRATGAGPRRRAGEELILLPDGEFEMGDAFGEGFPADGEWPCTACA
jgi:hypothetical protein